MCQSQKTSHAQFHLDVARESIKEEGRVFFAKGLVEGKMESHCLREPVSILGGEKVLQNWTQGL